MRVDAGPLVRRGLAAVIKAGPSKSTGYPRPLGVNRPPVFGKLRPRWDVQVIGADITRIFVVLVNTTRTNSAGSFRADRRLLGKPPMKCVHLFGPVIIEALHIHYGGQPFAPVLVHRFRDGASWVESAHEVLHRSRNSGACVAALQVFFVADRPDEDARMIAVPADHR